MTILLEIRHPVTERLSLHIHADVDVETGQAEITEALIQEIECHAEDIAQRFTS
jgi:hypothetical protein